VGDEAQHVEAAHALLAEQRHGVAVGLLEDRRDQVPGLDLLLLRALGVAQRALEDAVEGQGLAGLHGPVLGPLVEILVEEALEARLELLQVGARPAQHLGAPLVVEQGKEQVLHGEIHVAARHGLAHRRLQGELQLALDAAHSSSTPARSG
jgi:hypothetical protein